MSSKSTLLVIVAAVCVAAIAWTGCTVDFDAARDDVFPCTTDNDCIDGYECSSQQVCKEKNDDPVEAPPCDPDDNPDGDIDLDNDGYGTGDDRTNCLPQKRERDCDDDDPNRNPGQSELCDGIDNDCDDAGRIDNFDCESFTDCGAPPSGLTSVDVSYKCIDEQCVLTPDISPQDTQCSDIQISCNTEQTSFTYAVDGMSYGANEGPIEQCHL